MKNGNQDYLSFDTVSEISSSSPPDLVPSPPITMESDKLFARFAVYPTW